MDVVGLEVFYYGWTFVKKRLGAVAHYIPVIFLDSEIVLVVTTLLIYY
jgi:hypothetical protein